MLISRYRQDQFQNLYLPHTRAINQFVDQLGGGGRAIPYVDPSHGGSAAGILSVMFHPGNGRQGGARSGFLSLENADEASHQQLTDLRVAGIDPFDVSPWNMYPWYTDSDPTDRDIERGVATLARIIELMPALRAVLIQGTGPQKWWESFEVLFPTIANDPRFEVVGTYSAGWGALGQCSPEESARRKLHRWCAYKTAADLITSPSLPWRPPLRQAGREGNSFRATGA